jgi:hypothetical protein
LALVCTLSVVSLHFDGAINDRPQLGGRKI